MIPICLSLAFAAPPSTLPSRPVAVAAAPVVVPPFAAEMRSLLSAHHTGDLPSVKAVEANGGLAALRWLAGHDAHVRIRVRALDLLAAHGPDQDVCLRGTEVALPGAVQAAALRCLTALDSDDPAVTTALADALDHADPRVRAAAAQASTRAHSHVRPRDLEVLERKTP